MHYEEEAHYGLSLVICFPSVNKHNLLTLLQRPLFLDVLLSVSFPKPTGLHLSWIPVPCPQQYMGLQHCHVFMNRLHLTGVHPHSTCTKIRGWESSEKQKREHITGDQQHQDFREKVIWFSTTWRILYQCFSLQSYFCLVININLFVQHSKKGVVILPEAYSITNYINEEDSINPL